MIDRSDPRRQLVYAAGWWLHGYDAGEHVGRTLGRLEGFIEGFDVGLEVGRAEAVDLADREHVARYTEQVVELLRWLDVGQRARTARAARGAAYKDLPGAGAVARSWAGENEVNE